MIYIVSSGGVGLLYITTVHGVDHWGSGSMFMYSGSLVMCITSEVDHRELV